MQCASNLNLPVLPHEGRRGDPSRNRPQRDVVEPPGGEPGEGNLPLGVLGSLLDGLHVRIRQFESGGK